VGTSKLSQQPVASICIRLSKEAGDTNLSLRGMEADCRDLAARLGARVKEPIHVDDGISGSVRDRPEFLAWLDDGTSGAAQILIAPHADRLTREGVNAAGLVLDVVEGKDPHSGKVVRPPVRLATVDGLDSNDADAFRWRFVIAAEIARAELGRIADRNQKTRARLNNEGRWAGGPIPFGCRVREEVTHDERGKRKVAKYLEADPVEAEVLREVAQKLIAGQATHSVARWLVSSGSKTKKGNNWTVRTLKVALLCQASKAHVFDAATWRALKLRLEPKGNAGGGSPHGRPQRWLLARGNGICGTCKRNLTTARGQYVCANLACPAQVGIQAQAVDDYIEQEILDAYGDFPYLAAVTDVEGIEELEAARQAEELAQAALLEELTAGNLAALQAARETLAELESRPSEYRTRVVPTGQTFGQEWRAADIPERARMLRWAIDGPIVIEPSKGVVKRQVDLTRVKYVRAVGGAENWPD
jgi:site-specific DNA recombinase